MLIAPYWDKQAKTLKSVKISRSVGQQNNEHMPNSQYNPYDFRPSFRQELARWAYSGFVFLLLPLFFIVLLYKLVTGSNTFGMRVKERYGLLPKQEKTGGILLHCVSVGEVVAAAALVKRILENAPNTAITITTTTPTGRDQVTQLFGNTVAHRFLPYDTPLAMRHLLNRVKPQKILITEVELWPNLIHFAWKKQIPVHIINARMTDRSSRSYKKLSALFTPMLRKLTHICAQGENDFSNYQILGAHEQQLILTNNMKFDLTLSDKDKRNIEEFKSTFNTKHRKVLLGGSTHDPEEEVLLSAYQTLKAHHPDLLLILVPRHPQRFEKVELLLQKHPLHAIKLSQTNHIDDKTDVVLADKMGMLKQLYGIADIAFVGGSIANRGGHNALEPALLQVPVVMGEHIYNNPAICHALETQGALKITKTTEALTHQVAQWLQHPEQAKAAGLAGQSVIETNRGAIETTANVVGLTSEK